MGEKVVKRQSEKLILTGLESKLGEAQELPPQDRARLKIANSVLFFSLALIVLSSLAMILAPDTRIQQAETIFEFIKTIAPPMVTLVIGFYFRSENT